MSTFNAEVGHGDQRGAVPTRPVEGAFRRFAATGHAHTVLETEGSRAATEVKGARWANVVLSNVKRALDKVYHSVKQGCYARRYLAEAA